MRILLLLITALHIGCSSSIETSEPSPQAKAAFEKYGTETIISDAKEMVKGNSEVLKTRVTIPPQQWPESIASFHPEEVFAYESTVKMILNEKGRFSNGVKVYLKIPAHIRGRYDNASKIISSGSGYCEIKMGEGISWFWEKQRISNP